MPILLVKKTNKRNVTEMTKPILLSKKTTKRGGGGQKLLILR